MPGFEARNVIARVQRQHRHVRDPQPDRIGLRHGHNRHATMVEDNCPGRGRLSKRFRLKIILENHYLHPAVFPTARGPEAVLPSPILHLTFPTAPPDGCKGARRSEDTARRL